MAYSLSWKNVVWVGALVATMQASAYAATSTFRAPTPEELAMKELPGRPGLAAVVLNREEITKDDLHMVERYNRIKILSEEGKKYANVELNFVRLTGFGDNDFTDDKTVGEIAGRTIHADGKIIPFTGKPYKKTMEKGQNVSYQAMVFTLPDVEVGSIIEYRYVTRIDDHAYEAPDWYIQGALYLKAAHYEWYPTRRTLSDSKERPINAISWFPILPQGTKLERLEQASAEGGPTQVYTLDVKDVPPTPDEEYQPPVKAYSYRVLFNFTSYRNADEYWKSEGKDWSKRADAFIAPNSEVRAETEKVIAGAATDDDKLRRIYAAVQALENTRFTRERDKREDKAEGGEKIKSAADVLSHRRGTPSELTELFVSMSRAAGMKAYVMLAPNRNIETFTQQWLSFQQFDDLVAIVNVAGKDVFFDPGWGYMPYAHLAWQHTLVPGLRQVEGGTAFASLPGGSAKDNSLARVANLKMDEQGNVTGKIDMTYAGEFAVGWRHTALEGDDASLRNALEESVRKLLPKSLEVKIAEIVNLTAYEEPLKVSYSVEGRLGNRTGKRMVVPADLFLAGASATFPHEKREEPIYFHYPEVVRDAVRVNYGNSFQPEVVPVAAKNLLPAKQSYDLTVVADAGGFTTRRSRVLVDMLIPVAEYDELRKFYMQFESKDQESVVLKLTPASAAAN